MSFCQPVPADKEGGSFAGAMIVVLGDRIADIGLDSFQVKINQFLKGRAGVLPLVEDQGGLQQIENPDRGFLAAFPVGAGVDRVFPAPVGKPLVYGIQINSIAADGTGPGQGDHPFESGGLPDIFDITDFGVKICQFGPVMIRIGVAGTVKGI